MPDRPGAGTVYLVGAGPGDPGLLTVRGLRCLQRADVVIYDRLVNPSLLAHAPPSAERIYAREDDRGRAQGQEEITALLIERARSGKRVVRLKGGDPFVFGRGAEEAGALAAAGIPFEVVPGISAAIAVPAYAGIPVTDRRFSSSFAVLTGRQKEGGAPEPEAGQAKVGQPWRSLAGRADTLVGLMGVGALEGIVSDLLAGGLPPTTPAALIHRATTPRQRTLIAPLGEIVSRAREADLQAPATLVVGATASLAESLNWYETRPLFGLRVAVTRAQEETSALAAELSELGADPVEVPAIVFGEPDDWAPLDRALAHLTSFDWVVVASAHAVEAVTRRLRQQGRDARAWAGVRIAAIGSATAQALEGQGLRADLVPPSGGGQSLVEVLISEPLQGARFLLPRSNLADDTLLESLTRLGAQVEPVIAYRTLPPPGLAAAAREALEGGLDLVCFASPSAVRHLFEALGSQAELLRAVPAACIGPATARAAREAGLAVAVEAAEHTIPGLLQAIQTWRSSGPQPGTPFV